MKIITLCAASLALSVTIICSASAHEQRAVVDGKRVQPTPEMIQKLKREHPAENKRKAYRPDAESSPPSHAQPDRKKGNSGVGKDEGLQKQNQ